MSAERFRKLSEVFEKARSLPFGERGPFLREACRDDAALLGEVEALLRAHEDVAAGGSDPLLDAGEQLRGAVFDDRPGELPQAVGRYRVIGEVARGGIGVVLRAHDDEIGRDVAIKLLRPDLAADARLSRRLHGEGRIGGQLQHPSIVPVHELGLLGGTTPYVAMKLVEGRTLASLLAARQEPAAERLRFLRILEQVCEAMAYAHSRRVIHRDLKPANVMIGAFGEVQVMDWGLAKALSDRDEAAASTAVALSAADTSLSIAGAVMGTPAYMSPEQARGELDALDERTDVFSLGAILCEVLTGEPPFNGKTTGEVLDKARRADLGDAFARLGACAADAELLDLARAALSPRKDDRPRDAASVAASLSGYSHSLEERARTASLAAAEARVRAQGERKARRLTVVIALLILAGLAVSGGIYLVAERDRLEQARAAAKGLEAAVDEARVQLQAAGERSVADASYRSAWETARVAARNARALIREDVDADLRQRAETLAADIERQAELAAFIEEIERTRSEGESLSLDREDPHRPQLFADLFRRRFGVDLESLEPEAAAAKLLATGQAGAIVPALDDWARVLRDTRRATGNRWKKIVEIARRADADPFRQSLRAALLAADAAELEQLVRGLDPRQLEPPSLLLVGMALRQLRGPRAALPILSAAQRAYPRDFWINWFLASTYVAPGEDNLPMATHFFTAALSLRPESPIVYQALAKAYRDGGQLQDSLAVARRGLEVLPDSPQVLIPLGVSLLAVGDDDGARAAYERAEANAGPDTQARSLAVHNQGILHSRAGRSDDAIRCFEQALEIDPQRYSNYNSLGYELFTRGKLKAALEAYRKAVKGYNELAVCWTNYGNALLAAGDVLAARAAFEEALKVDPRHALALRLLGTAHLRSEGTGQSNEKALASYLQSVRLEPEQGYAFEKALEILGAAGERLAPEALRAWIEGLEKLLRAGPGGAHALAGRVYATAWTLLPEPGYATSVLLTAELGARRTRRQDPAALVLLAEVLAQAGRKLAALETAEEALALPAGDTPRARALVERIRAGALPDLWTFGSVDAAVARLEPGTKLETARERFASFLGADAAGAARLRRLYLEARLLQLEGAHEPAISKLEEVLGFERGKPEPFLALRESLEALHQGAAAETAFREALVKGAPEAPLPRPPATPRVLEPGDGVEVDPAGFDLRATPFRHIDPRVRFDGARWRIWAAGVDPERHAALDVLAGEDEGRLRVPAWLLLPGESYQASVLHHGSDGRWSAASEALSFRTRAAPLEARPFDLREQLRFDVVRNPGDDVDDGLDPQGNLLGIEGFDGTSTLNPEARGLPLDGRVGVHQLAAYDGPNSLRLDAQHRDDVRLRVPAGRYAAVRLLVAGTNGRSSVTVRVEYTDGTTEKRTAACLDWFAEIHERPWTEELHSVTCPLNGMDRFHGEIFEERDDAALLDVLIPLSSAKELAAIVLEGSSLELEGKDTRLHVFAVTGMALRE